MKKSIIITVILAIVMSFASCTSNSTRELELTNLSVYNAYPSDKDVTVSWFSLTENDESYTINITVVINGESTMLTGNFKRLESEDDNEIVYECISGMIGSVRIFKEDNVMHTALSTSANQYYMFTTNLTSEQVKNL